MYAKAGPLVVRFQPLEWVVLFRASQNTWTEELSFDPNIFKWPPWRLVSCEWCGNDPRKKFLHRAIVHIGCHYECHNGMSSAGTPCPVISTSSWLTKVLSRLTGKSTLLHVIFVPRHDMNQYALDMSEIDEEDLHGKLTAAGALRMLK